MAIPMVQGDTAGVFQPPGAPPPSPFTVTALSGSSKVRFDGLPVMLDGRNTCTNTTYGAGTLIGISPVTTKLKVEGLPVLVNGASVAFFGSFPGTAATIVASKATNISVS